MIKIHRPSCPNPMALANKNYKYPHNKEALRKASHDKCMYCESKITHIGFAHIEHIKPKSEFPELTYVWDNLGYACEKCNNTKHDKYDSNTPFIDPYSEDPENHFVAYGGFIFPRQGSERGELTIEEVGLNRAELIGQRKEHVDRINIAIKQCFRTSNQNLKEKALELLKEEALPDKEYSFVAKIVLKQHDLSCNY